MAGHHDRIPLRTEPALTAIRSIALIVVLLAVGCAGPVERLPPPTAPDHPRHLGLEVRYVTRDDKLLADPSLPKVASVVVMPIPGHVTGAMVPPSLWSGVARIGEEATLDLAELERRAAERASRLARVALREGFQIDPPSTKIARLGVFAADWRTGEGLGLAVLSRGALLRGPLFLVFFDRPCRFEGRSVEGSTEFVFDVEVERSGVSLLQSEPDGSRYRVRQSPLPRQLLLKIVR